MLWVVVRSTRLGPTVWWDTVGPAVPPGRGEAAAHGYNAGPLRASDPGRGVVTWSWSAAGWLMLGGAAFFALAVGYVWRRRGGARGPRPLGVLLAAGWGGG